MISAAIFVAIVGAATVAGALITLRASHRGWPPAPAWRAGVRLGVLVALGRLTAIWAVFVLVGDASGWRQIVASAVLVLSAVVELALASVWLDDLGLWRMMVTVLVFLSSLVVGQLIALLAKQMRTSFPRGI